MESPHLIADLWDYGWLYHDVLEFKDSPGDGEMISAYRNSPSFHTNFLKIDVEASGIHGPFVADQIVASDLEMMDKARFNAYLHGIRFSDDRAQDEDAHSKILSHLKVPMNTVGRCFVLRFDETNWDRFHDWGFVFHMFREILIPDPDRGTLDRFVIGYD